jgi:hypothetical protein
MLAITSVKDPASAARTLMAMGFSTYVLWNALILAAAGNALVFTLSSLWVTGPTPFPGYFGEPLVYFAIVTFGLVFSTLSIVWTGRIMGGKGRLADILVLMVWIQILRLLVQIVVIMLVYVAPVMSAILVLASALVGIYMLVHFIDQAHGFGSPGKAAVVMVASFLDIAIGLSILLILVGGPNVGSTLAL